MAMTEADPREAQWRKWRGRRKAAIRLVDRLIELFSRYFS
jgi:hypothetical protein